jgi:hypothetical protein
VARLSGQNKTRLHRASEERLQSPSLHNSKSLIESLEGAIHPSIKAQHQKAAAAERST